MKNRKTPYAFLLCTLFCFGRFYSFSQSGVEPSKLKQFNITINFDDYTVKTQMLSQNKSISVDNERIYMWYGSQKIIETKGGYDGKLIHGTYRAFYLNNQLKEQGEIKYGLRSKEWKYWYADGNLKEVINWKNGVKNGAYYLYNDYGQLMAKGRFKKDKLHGLFYTYGPNGIVTDKKKYKRGDETALKVKRKWSWKKRTKTEEKTEKKENPPKAETGKSKSKTPFFKRIFKKKKSSEKSENTGKREKKKIITT